MPELVRETFAVTSEYDEATGVHSCVLKPLLTRVAEHQFSPDLSLVVSASDFDNSYEYTATQVVAKSKKKKDERKEGKKEEEEKNNGRTDTATLKK